MAKINYRRFVRQFAVDAGEFCGKQFALDIEEVQAVGGFQH
jgi:hypothetical protein